MGLPSEGKRPRSDGWFMLVLFENRPFRCWSANYHSRILFPCATLFFFHPLIPYSLFSVAEPTAPPASAAIPNAYAAGPAPVDAACGTPVINQTFIGTPYAPPQPPVYGQPYLPPPPPMAHTPIIMVARNGEVIPIISPNPIPGLVMLPPRVPPRPGQIIIGYEACRAEVRSHTEFTQY